MLENSLSFSSVLISQEEELESLLMRKINVLKLLAAGENLKKMAQLNFINVFKEAYQKEKNWK